MTSEKFNTKLQEEAVPILIQVGWRLYAAFESTGFAYIKNHGVPQDLIDDAMTSSEAFFKLRREVKDVYKKDDSVQHGYVEPNREIFTDTTTKASVTIETTTYIY